jgi:hypothetical protein
VAAAVEQGKTWLVALLTRILGELSIQSEQFGFFSRSRYNTRSGKPAAQNQDLCLEQPD